MAVPVELGSHPGVARSGSEPTESTGAVPRGTHTAGRWAGKGVSRNARHHNQTVDMQERSWQVFSASRFDLIPLLSRGISQYSLVALDQTLNFHGNTNLQVSNIRVFSAFLQRAWMLPEPHSSPTRIN